ncbi:MAG: hypothetical protein L0387_24930 [Acidobacteria bacterium]|nr:hypothetical protein [Acidobacteriota bacterium]
MQLREISLIFLGAGLATAIVLWTLLYIGLVRRIARLEGFRGLAIDFFYELINRGGEPRQPLRDQVRRMAEDGERRHSHLTDFAE